MAARRRFLLRGPAARLDPARDAYRADLADIALAGSVFVGHYAEPVAYVSNSVGTAVREAADSGAGISASLAQGDFFMVLDVTGQWAWGYTGKDHIVGHVELAHLDEVAK